jgi:putative hydrolase of the HAD superfamily
MNIRTLLFDVDNTLYDAHCGVEEEMNRRINILVSDRLGISTEEAIEMRKVFLPEYGTTLRWLQVCHGLEDAEAYMEHVHPENIKEYLCENPELREMLQKTSCRLEILTNGPEFHARRVLKALGINDLFPHMYALEWMGFKGKPYTSAYEKVLAHMGESADTVLFLDDKEVNLEAFARLGGHGIIVGPDKGSGKFPWIRDIVDLDKILPACCGMT